MINDARDLPEEEIARHFYGLVFDDPLLGPLFKDRSRRHPERLALYLAEVFRGDDSYLCQRGGLPTLVARHRGWRFTDAQRDRWVLLMGKALAKCGASNVLQQKLDHYFNQTALLAQHESEKGHRRTR